MSVFIFFIYSRKETNNENMEGILFVSRVVSEIEIAKFHIILKDRGICCHFGF